MKDVVETGRQLAGAWIGNNDSDFYDLLEEVMRSEARDNIVYAASGHIPPENRLDFVEDVFSAAGDVGIFVSNDEHESESSANIRLFSMAVTGSEQDIKAALSDDNRDVFLEALSAAGLIHKNASVLIADEAISAQNIVAMAPWRIRSIVENFALGFGDDFSLESRGRVQNAMLTTPELAGPPDQHVTRIIFGARLSFLDDGMSDYLDDQPLDSLDGMDINAVNDWIENRGKCQMAFKDEIERRMRERNIDIVVSAPESWRRTLDIYCVSVLSNQLLSEMSVHGLKSFDKAIAHVVEENGYFFAFVKKDGVLVGPATLPQATSSLANKGLRQWFASTFEKVAIHQNSTSVLATEEATIN